MSRRRWRKPTTWPHPKHYRGPDTSGIYPGLGLSDRSQAAKTTTDEKGNPVDTWLESMFPNRTITLGIRHQNTPKFVVKKLIDQQTYKLKLFMGGGKFIFVRERIADKRYLSASRIYYSLDVALYKYQRNQISFVSFSTLSL